MMYLIKSFDLPNFVDLIYFIITFNPTINFWIGMKDHTTWTLLYIDYSTCTSQLYCSGHVSSIFLAQLDRSDHVSSTFNITSSLWLLSKQHCGHPLEGIS